MSGVQSWFPYRVPADGTEIFAFPHAGAASTVFHALRRHLEPDGTALTAAVLPGHGRRVREQPHRDMTALVADFDAAAASDGYAAFQGDYVLLGHCLGALVSFELARRLVDAPCRNPRLLVLCHCPPPTLVYDSGMSRLPTEELLARTSTMGGTPAGLLADSDFRTLLDRVLRADWALVDDYVFRGPARLPIPVLAVRGADDPFVDATDLPLWGDHTSAGFRTAEVGAGHWSLAEDAAGELADEIRAALSKFG